MAVLHQQQQHHSKSYIRVNGDFECLNMHFSVAHSTALSVRKFWQRRQHQWYPQKENKNNNLNIIILYRVVIELETFEFRILLVVVGRATELRPWGTTWVFYNRL